MNSAKRIIFIVTDSAATMTDTDWYRQLNSTAATVDNRIHISSPSVDYISRPQAREKNYWMPKSERFKK